MTDRKQFEFFFNKQCETRFQRNYLVEVWCDGRLYDPSIEAYRPVYSYRIVADDMGWEYVSNDIHGAANEVPDLVSASKSLFAFLLASQEGLPEDTEGTSENAEMFPEHVREFAYLLNEEITIEYMKLEAEMEKK